MAFAIDASAIEQDRSVHSEEVARANAAMMRYARGDEAAFAELYRILSPRLYRLCRRLCGPEEADELLQEVFLKMHRGRATFTDAGSVFGWSYAIARATHVDRVRHRRRRPELTFEPGHLALQPASESTRPDYLAKQQLCTRELERELSTMSENLRAAFVLVKLRGRSCMEAAVALGVSISAVKQRVHRAGDELRASLTSLSDAS